MIKPASNMIIYVYSQCACKTDILKEAVGFT